MRDNIILQVLINQILEKPAHEEIYISKDAIPHPRALGFRPDIGEPRGQIADYRLTLPDGRGIHGRDYRGFWGFHWDKTDPLWNGIEHIRRDSPGYYVLACTSAGSGVGATVGGLARGKSKAGWGMLIGALLGALVGLATAEWD